MKRRRLFSDTYLYISAAILFTIILLTVSGIPAVKRIIYAQAYKTIKESALLIRNIFPADRIKDSAYASLFCRNAAKDTDLRITVMTSDGTVTGDSHKDSELLENHMNREEVLKAVKKGEGFSRRYSKSIGTGMLYFALPVVYKDSITGIIRVSIPEKSVSSVLKGIYTGTLIIILAVMAVVLFLSYYIARRISSPVETLAEMTKKVSALDFKTLKAIEGPKEIYDLSVNLKEMAGILEQKFNAAIHQRKELRAVFSALIESIVVLDKELRILEINKAAINLFKTDIDTARNSTLMQITGNSELINLAEKTVENGKTHGKTLLLKEKVIPEDEYGNQKFTSRDLFLQVNTSYLETEDRNIRIILVLHDITQLKTLERIRRDFVANVSHELKTPVTSILGFVETLKEGAINDRDVALEFLDIIETQSKRLDLIIKDLLSLSTLESYENTEVGTELCSFKEIISSAVEVCGRAMKKKNTEIKIINPGDLKLKVNSVLMEQALVNLIDNAVKYCPEGSRITVKGEEYTDYILVRISDNGPGIPEDDIPRVFERFYTVDKARSRELGGTGLGLAIVKHIILAHKGEISLKSARGKGSEFIIRLPK